jgi:Domain of unknown function (DUF4260)
MRGRRLVYAPLALALLSFAISEVVVEDTGLWQLLVFAVLPDLALFLGIGGGLARGQLHPRAVPLYNALHRLIGPALLIATAFWVGVPWLVAGLAWAAHVAFDRALGYGLRDPAGFQRHAGATPAVN